MESSGFQGAGAAFGAAANPPAYVTAAIADPHRPKTDTDRDACRTINANLDKLKLKATVLCQDVVRALASERGTYDLVLADPPYDYDGLDRLAPQLRRILAPDGLLVYQTDARAEPEVEGLGIRTSRKYGSARLTLFEP